MTEPSEIRAFPTIRAQMGDWFYYITTLPFSEVARRVRPATGVLLPESLSTWVQRIAVHKRQQEIATYLKVQPERFFNSIVVGVLGGEPNWYDIEIEENALFETPGLDPRFHHALGILELTGDEELYAIDGEHRIAGIVEALKNLKSEHRTEDFQRLADEDLTVIFVAADINEPRQLEKVRRMFSTLNKRAVRVSDSELIALDEDDAAAIVTRRVVAQYRELSQTSPPRGRGQHLGV